MSTDQSPVACTDASSRNKPKCVSSIRPTNSTVASQPRPEQVQQHQQRESLQGCRHKWYLCPCVVGFFYMFLGLVGMICFGWATAKDNATFASYTNSTEMVYTNSTELEIGWNYSVKVNSNELDPSSNISVNISSTADTSAQIFVMNCKTLHTITVNLVPSRLNFYFPIINILAPLNYKTFNHPLYAISGVLDYQCYVSSYSSDPSNDSCLQIFIFDNVTHYFNFEVDQAVDRSNCLVVGSPDSPIMNTISFHLQDPSYYYVKAQVEANYALNCTASGSVSVYDLSGLTPDECSLSWANTWCAFNISETLAGMQNDQKNAVCVLVYSKNDSTLMVSVDTTLVTLDVRVVGTQTLTLLVCLFAFLFIVGVGSEALTAAMVCMVWRTKHSVTRSEPDIELLQTLLDNEDKDV